MKGRYTPGLNGRIVQQKNEPLFGISIPQHDSSSFSDGDFYAAAKALGIAHQRAHRVMHSPGAAGKTAGADVSNETMSNHISAIFFNMKKRMYHA
jgi:hypothetical protein